MSRVIHDICVVTQRYTDRNGEEKLKWQKVGVELETERGGRIILLERWFNPAGIPDPENRGTVMLSMFDPKDSGAGPPQQQRQASAGRQPASRPRTETQPSVASDGFTDDIPF
ncbi:MAG: hypothetical protein ACLQMF_20130 [Rectinemataceae bacterium]